MIFSVSFVNCDIILHISDKINIPYSSISNLIDCIQDMLKYQQQVKSVIYVCASGLRDKFQSALFKN